MVIGPSSGKNLQVKNSKDSKIEVITKSRIGHVDDLILRPLINGIPAPSPNYVIQKTIDDLRSGRFMIEEDDKTSETEGRKVEGSESEHWHDQAWELVRSESWDQPCTAADLTARIPNLIADITADIDIATQEVARLQSLTALQLEESYISECQKRLLETEGLAPDDWLHWLKKPSWSTEETAALLLGQNPRMINSKSRGCYGPGTGVVSGQQEADREEDGLGRTGGPA